MFPRRYRTGRALNSPRTHLNPRPCARKRRAGRVETSKQAGNARPGQPQRLGAEGRTVTATADGRTAQLLPSLGAVRLRPPAPLRLRQQQLRALDLLDALGEQVTRT